jgi:hypothetical protein
MSNLQKSCFIVDIPADMLEGRAALYRRWHQREDAFATRKAEARHVSFCVVA